MMKRIILILYILISATTDLSTEKWSPVGGRIVTPFAKKVSPQNSCPEHPRPQMKRKQWLNLNGLWEYAVQDIPGSLQVKALGLVPHRSLTQAQPPSKWNNSILVPFAIDAPLSGIMKVLHPEHRLWYRKRFTIPTDWQNKRVLIHFQAVDWESTITVNGQRLGQHRGGYDPFTFDITKTLKKGENELLVCVWDATESQSQAIGKQIMPENRKGFRYQPTGGIWQTVWLEAVGQTYITNLRILPDVDKSQVIIKALISRAEKSLPIKVNIKKEGKVIASGEGQSGKPLAIQISSPRLWNPDDPFLYDLEVILREQGKVLDSLESYFGMRKVSYKKDSDGFYRIMLNNKPLFCFGPLDQGYWPDGILTPPGEDGIKFDLEFLKKIGCNMVRVHIKTHPDRWYYWCDRLGLVVWQDMICMPKYGQTVTKEASAQWEKEFARMVNWLYNHPSIIMWIPFNEGWSQYDTPRITKWVKNMDPSRLINNASGWTDFGVGDILDIHDYSFNCTVPLAEQSGNRALVLGECGGFNYQINGHTWHTDAKPKSENAGYVMDSGRATFYDSKRFEAVYALWIDLLRLLKKYHGLNGAVYTQITDVEHELNGWITYDREIPKFPVKSMYKLHTSLYNNQINAETILPPSREKIQEWVYTTAKPKEGWTGLEYNDNDWTKGVGPFSSKAVLSNKVKVGTVVNMSKRNNHLFLRKKFNLKKIPERTALRYYMSGTGHIYINGKLIRVLNNRSRDHRIRAGDAPLFPVESSILKKGENVIAVQTIPAKSGLFIDMGLVSIDRTLFNADPGWEGWKEAPKKGKAKGKNKSGKNNRDFIEPMTAEGKVILASSQKEGQVWAYTFDTPADNWMTPGFDDKKWKRGPGQFGKKNTPSSVIRTIWSTSDIWLRREFKLDRIPGAVKILLRHDEDARVYINGKPAGTAKGFGFTEISLTGDKASCFRKGKNIIAIHCLQTKGGQVIDVAIEEVNP